MANVTKDLGPVTAYALAVEHGFDGTATEWAILQAQTGENAQRAESAANESEVSAQRANAQAGNAANSAQTAQNAQASANQAAANAQASANQAADSATIAVASAAQAKATQESIPADYTELAQNVGRLSEEMAQKINDEIVSIQHVWSSRRTLDRLCPAFEDSGPLVQCNPVEGYPLGVVSEIVSTQAGSGDPSPDNIRPISGWDAATVTRCGKNLLDVKQYVTYQTYGITFTANDDGSVTAEGTNVQGTVNNHPVVGSIYLPAGKYTVSGGKSGAFYTVVAYKKTDTTTTQFLSGNGTFSLEKAGNILVYLQVANGATVNETIRPMIECGGVATEYEPYQCETYSAQFPEVIYGGVLDWNTGVLTVTHRKVVLDENTIINSNTDIMAGQFLLYITNNKSKGKSGKAYYSSHLLYHETHAYNGTKADAVTIYTEHIWFYTPRYPQLADFKAFLKEQREAGTPVTVVYELLNPYIIQLTPQQIAALAGVNNIWSDTGNTTVIGRTDPVYVLDGINARLAALEAATINNI